MKAFVLVLAGIGVAGCNRGGVESKEAVRQGVIDYLATRGNLSLNAMNVDIVSVNFKQNEAEAVVAFSPKGSKTEGQGMTIPYTLERKGNRWVVKPRAGTGQSPHGGAMQGMPTMPPPSAAPGAPSGELPQGHPPVGKK